MASLVSLGEPQSVGGRGRINMRAARWKRTKSSSLISIIYQLRSPVQFVFVCQAGLETAAWGAICILCPDFNGSSRCATVAAVK